MSSQRRDLRTSQQLGVLIAIVALLLLGLGRATADPRPHGAQKPAAGHISPEVLSSHAVFSAPCSKIIYSSNRDGLLRPFVVDMKDATHPRVSKIELASSGDFVAQALSPDCHTLAMVSDRDGNGKFDIYLYDLERSTLKSLASRSELDEGEPVFAPHDHIVAYLAGNRLALYDYAKALALKVPSFPISFRSVTWSDDGSRIYMEDEWTNIWQYDLSGARFLRVWSAPQLSYTPRAISQRGPHLLFSSDHECNFSQIYRLDLASGALKRLYSSEHDQHSPSEPSPGHYTFRSIVDASFIAGELHQGTFRPLSPPQGVTYGFSPDFGAPLLMYSNDQLPIGLYWYDRNRLIPLLPPAQISHQPAAIPIKNADGMTNFLYLPSPSPKAWLIWLHGGPREEISPRFNLYFDFLAQKNIAVYAINYPGSTGMGKAYALSGKSEQASIPEELAAVERDVAQLQRLHPEISSFVMLGVSYGSILTHLFAAKHPEVTRLIDFSGVADSKSVPAAGDDNRSYPPTLFIYGQNDFALRDPARLDLISRYEKHGSLARLIIPDEGHYIQRRGSIDQILQRLGEFLQPVITSKEAATQPPPS